MTDPKREDDVLTTLTRLHPKLDPNLKGSFVLNIEVTVRQRSSNKMHRCHRAK